MVDNTNIVDSNNIVDTNLIITSGIVGRCIKAETKTLIPCENLIEIFKEINIEKILITISALPSKEENKYLFDNIHNKLSLFMIPLINYFVLQNTDYYLNFNTYSYLNFIINNGNVKISDSTYIRGITSINCIVIVNDIQNNTVKQIKIILAYMGIIEEKNNLPIINKFAKI